MGIFFADFEFLLLLFMLFRKGTLFIWITNAIAQVDDLVQQRNLDRDS